MGVEDFSCPLYCRLEYVVPLGNELVPLGKINKAGISEILLLCYEEIKLLYLVRAIIAFVYWKDTCGSALVKQARALPMQTLVFLPCFLQGLIFHCFDYKNKFYMYFSSV